MAHLSPTLCKHFAYTATQLQYGQPGFETKHLGLGTHSHSHTTTRAVAEGF